MLHYWGYVEGALFALAAISLAFRMGRATSTPGEQAEGREEPVGV